MDVGLLKVVAFITLYMLSKMVILFKFSIRYMWTNTNLVVNNDDFFTTRQNGLIVF